MEVLKNRFVVDGEARSFESIHDDMSIGDALSNLHRSINGDSVVVCRILVDGVELTPSNEPAFAALQVGNVEKVEVETAHPQTLAQDTLQTLCSFLEELIALSRRVATDIADAKVSHDSFLKLVDGVQTACEAIHVSKKASQKSPVLGVDKNKNNQQLAVLEADLNSILVDLLEAQIAGHAPFVQELLDQHLPNNLREWIDHGIPALMPSI